jgi:cell division protein FtsA
VTHVAEPVTRAIRQAEDDLGIKITQAVVGMPKFPIYQESSNATIRDRGEDTDITAEDIANLKSLALSIYPLQDDTKEAIFGAVAQSFSNGEDFQVIENDIIGMTGDVLEGNFKVFVGKKNDLRKIDSVMAKSEIVAMRKYFTAECTAKAVLTDAEMENGVALIDFGGGCTSVAIYHGNVMRHYASIPFGGRNITQDIKTECQISERLAENIKLAFGACMPDKLQSLSDKIIHVMPYSKVHDLGLREALLYKRHYRRTRKAVDLYIRVKGFKAPSVNVTVDGRLGRNDPYLCTSVPDYLPYCRSYDSEYGYVRISFPERIQGP